LSPTPSTGTGFAARNGNESAPVLIVPKIIRPVKKVASPPRTAVAHGTISRWRLRVTYSTADEASERTHAHRSSDPAWLDHIAVSL
jgi:hypothetical protein